MHMPFIGQSTNSDRDPTIVVLLSLYLLLLAFFILLNSISNYEESRAEVAIGSLTATFRTDLPVRVDRMSSSTSTGYFRAAATFRRDIRRLFEETLPLAQFSPVQRGGIFRVTVPADQLFHAGSLRFRLNGRRLLDGIADSLNRQEPGLRFEAELLLGTGPQLPDGPTSGALLEVQRAGVFARALRRRGAAPTSILTGIRRGDPGVAEITFATRIEQQAKISFETLVP